MIDTIRLKITNEKLYKSLDEYKNTNIDESKKAIVKLSGLKEKLLNGEVIELSIDDVRDINNLDGDVLIKLYEKGIDISFLDYFKLNGLGSWNRDVNIFLDCLNRSAFIEFSLNKMIFSHNLYNYDDAIFHLYNFLSEFYKRFDVQFDYKEFSKIELYRLDLAYNYKFQNDVLSVLQTAFYKNSRHKRKRIHFYESSLMFVGSWYSLKIYDKHKEFLKHDYKELRDRLLNVPIEKIAKSLGYHIYKGKLIDVDEIDKEVILSKILKSLLDYSENMLRVEVSIRRKKLEYDNILTLGYLDKLDLQVYFEYFLETMGVKSVSRQSLDELYDVIDDANLLSFISFVSVYGSEKAKEKYKRSTFYYYKKRLKDKYNVDIDVFNFDETTDIDFSINSNVAVLKVV